MRAPTVLAMAAFGLVWASCDRAADVVAPAQESPEPIFHYVDRGNPADDPILGYVPGHSVSFFDVDLGKSLTIKVSQQLRQVRECPDNTFSHFDYQFGNPEYPDWSAWESWGGGADGGGYYRVGWKSGLLRVEKACWFAEWNNEIGAPESLLVWGHTGWRRHEFVVALVSRGFPNPVADPQPRELPYRPHGQHLLGGDGRLLNWDKAVLWIKGAFVADFLGELHHEDAPF